MISININDIALLNIKGVDDCCIICGIRKSQAINLMENVELTETSRTL